MPGARSGIDWLVDEVLRAGYKKLPQTAEPHFFFKRDMGSDFDWLSAGIKMPSEVRARQFTADPSFRNVGDDTLRSLRESRSSIHLLKIGKSGPIVCTLGGPTVTINYM